MSTTKCSNCGCEDSFLTSPAPCPTPAGCPDPEPCYTVTDAQCTVYTGANIVCSSTTVVASNTVIADALDDIISYFCSSIQTVNGSLTTINTNISNLQAAQGLFDTAFRASLTPTLNVNTVSASLANSSIINGVTIVMATGNIEYQVVDNVTTSQYNVTTGIWTCPQTGKYDINYNVYLTCPDQTLFGWGNTPTTTGAAYSIAVTSPGATGTSVYCADTYTVIKGVYASRIYLTGGIQGKMLTAGEQLVLRHQNMTGINYTGISGDNIDWAIRRVG
jgi:hypothetical protein